MSCQVIDNLRKIIFAALSAALDHVGDDLGPSISRQAAAHYNLRSMTSAAHTFQRFFAGSVGKLLILAALPFLILLLLILVLLRVILPALALLGFLSARAYANTAGEQQCDACVPQEQQEASGV